MEQRLPTSRPSSAPVLIVQLASAENDRPLFRMIQRMCQAVVLIEDLVHTSTDLNVTCVWRGLDHRG
jgi:hypothetical protein